MDEEKRHLREEVAELAEAVRQLREQLAGQHHCHCYYLPCPLPHYYTPPYVGPIITYTNAPIITC